MKWSVRDFPMKIHKAIREKLGYSDEVSDNEIIKDWKRRTSFLCKPCWELKYCPYGPLVEDFPLIRLTKDLVIRHKEYLEKCIKTGRVQNGSPLTEKQKKAFPKDIASIVLDDYPDSIPDCIQEANCKNFGHMCPVFFCAERYTETKEFRQFSRIIPREVMLKVVRRDGQICQKCFKHVPDTEIEFDHIIPFSKGGPTTVENLRVLCRDCNRKKSDSLSEILDEYPLDKHFVDKSKTE